MVYVSTRNPRNQCLSASCLALPSSFLKQLIAQCHGADLLAPQAAEPLQNSPVFSMYCKLLGNCPSFQALYFSWEYKGLFLQPIYFDSLANVLGVGTRYPTRSSFFSFQRIARSCSSLLRSVKEQVICFQAIPISFQKNRGMDVNTAEKMGQTWPRLRGKGIGARIVGRIARI
jgi:hypothetical protein